VTRVIKTESKFSPQTILGLRLFAIYTVFYASFVLVNAFAPEWSEVEIIGGLNLALLWGFALIGAAFVLAMIYGILCGKMPAADNEDQA